MGIEPPPFWANLFLYSFSLSMFRLLLLKKQLELINTMLLVYSRVTLLCAINDDGEFSKSFKCIYSGELETKLEHRGRHACFLDLDIKIEDGIFAYKLFDKRHKFPFFIALIVHFESNIPSTILAIFYGSVFSEFLCIAKFTLKLEHIYAYLLIQKIYAKCQFLH